MKSAVSGRMLAVDALRGYAAVGVVVFHLFYNSAQADAFATALPPWVYAVPGLLRSGVAVFFVISGLVIGYTTYNIGNRARDIGRFALRRQLRLDPPYYAAIALVLILGAAESFAGFESPSFSVGDVLVNMLYLQGFFDAQPVLAVAWTLCMEVQFYIVLVLTLWVAGKVTRGGNSARQAVTRIVVLALGAVSLTLPLLGVSGTGPWFLGMWWYFALGMCAAWYVRNAVGDRFVIVTFGMCGAVLVGRALTGQMDQWAGEWFSFGTVLLLCLLARTGRITRNPGRIPLYLGRVSYSLYLVHLPVLTLTMGATFQLLGSAPWALFVALIVGATTSFAAAELLRRLVEQPSIDWAGRVGSYTRRSTRPGTSPSGFQGSPT